MAGPFDYQNTGKVNQYPFTKRQMFNQSNSPCYGINSLDSVFADQVKNGANYFLDIAYNGTLYVAIFQNGAVYSSPNLGTWTIRTLTNLTNLSSNSVVYGNGVFVVTGTSTSGTSHNIWTSTDGITWTNNGAISTMVSASEGATLSFVNGSFYATSSFGNNPSRSTDGITWTAISFAPTVSGLVEMIGGVLFIKEAVYSTAINNQYTYKFYSIDDGLTWAALTFNIFQGISFYNGVWYGLYLTAANTFSYFSSTNVSSGYTLYRTINGPMPSNTSTKQNLGAGSSNATYINTGVIYPAVCQILNKVIWVNYYQVWTPSTTNYYVTENQVTISDPFSDTIVNDNNKVFSFLASGTELANLNTISSPSSSIIRTSSAVRIITDKFIFIRGSQSNSYLQKIKLPINEYVSL